jgi:hypothetical protein
MRAIMKSNCKNIHGKYSYLFLFVVFTLISLGVVQTGAASEKKYEVLVHDGEASKTIEFLKSKGFWGENKHQKDLKGMFRAKSFF